MKYITLLPIAATLAACSPEKRLARLVRNNPQLVQSDTVRDTIAVYMPAVEHDTLFNLSFDTMYMDTGRLHVAVHVDTILRKVYVKGTCDADTVFKTVDRIINTTQPVQTIVKRKLSWWLAALLIFVGLFIGNLISRK